MVALVSSREEPGESQCAEPAGVKLITSTVEKELLLVTSCKDV
jgi:hypothetical protein